jgi:anti-sigma regulatory factor (Ser/Thr protein kinase)
MTDELTLQIETNFAAVQSANETASRWLAERTTATDLQYFVSLAIEEIATNCIKYGYDGAKNHVIEVKLSLSGSDVLVVTVVDDGHPFNPLEAREPDLSVPVEERPIGGLGIYLLRQLCDRMEYVREGGKNKLTLRKARRV